MKNRLFSILTALFVALTFTTSSLTQEPLHDPQQEHLSDGAKAQRRTGYINNIQYSPDGTKLAVPCLLGIRICDAQTGKELDVLTTHRYVFMPISVAYSPDGKTLASGCMQGTVHLWDTDTGTPLRILSGHTKAVWSVAYSPDGKTLASGSRDKTIRLWNVNTGQHLQTLKGHKGWVLSVAYSPDGRMIATGSEDTTLCLWDANTGQHLRTFKWDKGHVRSVAFSPDGRTIASASRNNTISTICLWDGGRKRPKTNKSYWLPKLERNRTRDAANQAELRARGWGALVLWECQLKDTAGLRKRIGDFLEGRV